MQAGITLDRLLPRRKERMILKMKQEIKGWKKTVGFFWRVLGLISHAFIQSFGCERTTKAPCVQGLIAEHVISVCAAAHCRCRTRHLSHRAMRQCTALVQTAEKESPSAWQHACTLQETSAAAAHLIRGILVRVRL